MFSSRTLKNLKRILDFLKTKCSAFRESTGRLAAAEIPLTHPYGFDYGLRPPLRMTRRGKSTGSDPLPPRFHLRFATVLIRSLTHCVRKEMTRAWHHKLKPKKHKDILPESPSENPCAHLSFCFGKGFLSSRSFSVFILAYFSLFVKEIRIIFRK